MMTHSSAPGKVILFGEHAVVYQRPALAVPVTQVHADVDVSSSQRPGIWIDAPNVHLLAELSTLAPGHALRNVVEIVYQALGLPLSPALNIRITSSIPVASGFGSGAAVSVALIRALSSFLGRPLSDELVNQLAFEIDKIYHGTPSGIDNTVITYARPVYFIKGQPLETFHSGNPFTLVIGDTGIAAPTREAVGDLRNLWQAEPKRWEPVFDKVGEISRKARSLIRSGEWQGLGPLMDANHVLLQEMTVSCPELDRLVAVAKASGALGAKLSGAGRGGNMLALVNNGSGEKIARALTAAGARRVIITEIQ